MSTTKVKTNSGPPRNAKLLETHPSGKRHLPLPKGPHSVGFVDIMTEGDPSSGTFFRLYYPSNERCQEEHEKWPRWAFEDKYISGTLTFLKCMAYRWPSWAPRDEFLFHNAMRKCIKITPRNGFKAGFKRLIGNVYVPIIQNGSIKNNTNWPLVVFSHGIGCCRFMYSQVCYDIASYGFVVAATEHRDGSACMAQFYDSSYNQQDPLVRWVEHQRCQRNENEYELRNKQVHQRSKEVSRTLDVLLGLNEGREFYNVYKNQYLPDQDLVFDFSQFQNTMNMSNPVIAGHSFGGATTILTLISDERFKVGVALDAWMFPLRDEDVFVSNEKPILFVNTESFLNAINLKKLSLLENSTKGTEDRKFLFIRGSVHQNQLDMPFLLRNTTMKKVLGSYSKTSPDKVMNVNNKLIVQFLFDKLGMAPSPELDEEITNSSILLQYGLGLSDNTPTTE